MPILIPAIDNYDVLLLCSNDDEDDGDDDDDDEDDGDDDDDDDLLWLVTVAATDPHWAPIELLELGPCAGHMLGAQCLI